MDLPFKVRNRVFSIKEFYNIFYIGFVIFPEKKLIMWVYILYWNQIYSELISDDNLEEVIDELQSQQIG